MTKSISSATLGNAPPPAKSNRSAAANLLRDLMARKIAVVGLLILLFWIFDSFLWPFIVPYKPQVFDFSHLFQHPTLSHPMGTDNYGRDVLSRVLAGVPSVLVIGGFGALIGMTLGLLVALITGYHGGVTDTVVMRASDGLLAVPLIIFGAMAVSMFGASKLTVIIVIGFIFTPIVGRSLRGPVIAERSKDYVQLAKLRGERSFYIMVVEILPNILGPLSVEATVRLGYGIFLSATLSFLGLGLQPPSADWGLAISEGRTYLQTAWWMSLFPALALASLVVSVNLIAEALRKILDRGR